MKTILKNSILMLSVFLLPLFGKAQQADTTMVVNGVCGMCKRTIEKAANLKGVAFAEWSPETKILKLQYDPSKTDLQKISSSINKAGYDTEYSAADEEAYQSLHKCCHYRDPEVVKDHEEKK